MGDREGEGDAQLHRDAARVCNSSSDYERLAGAL